MEEKFDVSKYKDQVLKWFLLTGPKTNLCILTLIVGLLGD